MRLPAALLVPLLLAASTATAADPRETAALAALGAKDVAPSDFTAVALAPWSHGPAGAWAVAALIDDADDEDALGTLWVGVLQPQARGFRLLGRDHSQQPARQTTPSSARMAIDPVGFRIAPQETALGVHVGEELITTSVSTSADTLVLFRLSGGALQPIFSALVEDSTLDKTPGGRDRTRRWIVRFDTHATRGMFDVIRARTGQKGGQRYTWNGRRYVSAGRG